MLEIAMEELKKAAEDFYKLTNIKIVFCDEKRNFLYSYPDDMCKLCKIVRTVPELHEKCLDCDNMGFDECEKSKNLCIYKCHMNLCEAITPITENEVIIGYMMMGQILPENSQTDVKKSIREISKKYKIDYGKINDALNELKTADNDFINSAATMMSMCACYLYYNKIIKNRSDIMMYQLKDYIDSHYTENLSVKEICKKLYISKSKLYKLSMNVFGMGVSEYIRSKRLDKAKKLLKDTDKSINAIAEESGYTDVNYFIRIFKKSENITPGGYRKKL